MYAIIEDSGSQIKVNKGDVFEIDHRDVEPGAKITFDRVLMLSDSDGDSTVGTPYVAGASVSAKVLELKKGAKIDVIKFKRRTGYRRKYGHRQPYVAVEVTDINAK